MKSDADRAQKHGMDEFISANPCRFDHAALFRVLQRQTLDHRLNDSYSCLVSKKAGIKEVVGGKKVRNSCCKVVFSSSLI